MATIRGRPEGYFETGCGGTYWVVQDETTRPSDIKGRYVLRQNDYLRLEYKDQHGDLYCLLEVEVNFIDSVRAEKNKYFRQYLKSHDNGVMQLNFAGLWVHSLPTNIDLGLWYQAFLEDKQNSFVATVKPALLKGSLFDFLKTIRF